MTRFILPLLALILLAGCGSKVERDQLVGTWAGTSGMTYRTMQENADGSSEQAIFLSEQVGEGRTLSLELKADGKATFTYKVPIEGTWSLADGVVTVVLPLRTTVDGGPGFGGIYKLKVEDEGTIAGPDPNLEGVPLEFTK